MLKLQKVSRFKKQQLAKRPKQIVHSGKFMPEYPIFEQQFDPSFLHQHFVEEQSNEYMREVYVSHYGERQFEDSILTMFIDQKVVLVQSTMMVFSLLSILLSISADKNYLNKKQVLILHSLLTLGLLILLFVRYFLKQELKNKQLLRQKLQNKYLKCFKQTTPEFLLLLIHPNLLTDTLSMTVSEPLNGSLIELSINTIFQIIMQFRIYLFFLCIISSSIYCNTRASRLCRIYSTKNNLIFGVKSLFQYKPLTFLVLLYMSLVITLGQMISLSEKDYLSDFRVFQNSIWFIIITMGTVGYGDYSPITYLGRIISFTAAISGIIISSLLILTLSRYLSMSNGQNKSHVTLKRLQLRKLLQNYSKQTINFTTKLAFRNKNLSSNQQKDSLQNKQVMQKLKKKTQKVKFAMRRIKNIVDTDNLKQEINRLFEALSQSLNLIYKFQQQYSQLLIQLYHKEKGIINEIQFSFTTQIENIIKDR